MIGQLTLKCQGKGLFWNSLPWAIVKPLTNAASPVLQTWVSSDSRTASQIALNHQNLLLDSAKILPTS